MGGNYYILQALLLRVYSHDLSDSDCVLQCLRRLGITFVCIKLWMRISFITYLTCLRSLSTTLSNCFVSADLVRRLLYIQSWTLLNSNRSITLIIKERLQTLLLNLQTAANGAALLVKPHMDLDYVREFDDVSFLFLCSGQLCFSCFGSDLLRFMISQVSRPFEISPHRSSISSGGRREFLSHHIMFESIFGF